MRYSTLLTLLIVAGLAACNGQSTALTEQAELQIPGDAVSITVDPVVSTQYSGVREARRLVIRDAEAWIAFWDEVTAVVTPRPEPPAVDFEQEMVIAAAMGQRATGGYTISIPEVYQQEGSVYAVVKEVAPAANCIVTQALSAPVVAVSMPRSEDAVSFVEREETVECR
ncbi:MAG: protease complex subunit PrcB family protein [Gemmatimonadota bacterium]|nr:MAG: protease complex subunit PrcB family protein [Gemmatimonadota bacterium]